MPFEIKTKLMHAPMLWFYITSYAPMHTHIYEEKEKYNIDLQRYQRLQEKRANKQANKKRIQVKTQQIVTFVFLYWCGGEFE